MASDPLFVKLYLDEDVHPDLAEAVRRNGFDCQSAADAKMLGRTDEQQLEYAASQGRCLVTFNVADFVVLAREWTTAGKAHAGILVTKQVGLKALGQLLKRLLAFLNTTTADEMADVLRYL
jgi:predicted nuclease of predicted toxin-antitoxin system